ncbi:MAG: SBBP repeat-containing protein [candidate division WOR-3 bacterium]|nr:SBBP repeat-containing protein [candidate division WOR-3 bacterium]
MLSFFNLVNAIDILWTRRYNFAFDKWAWGDIDILTGDLIVAGESDVDSNPVFVLIRYNRDGDTVWTRVFDSPYLDWLHGCAVDRAGNVIIAGSMTSGGGVVKYDRDGNLCWYRRVYPRQTNYFSGVASDESLNIYVAGGRGSNAQLMKLSPAGESLWLKVYDFGYPLEDIVSLYYSTDGYIAGAGDIAVGGGQFDCLSIKWNATGDVSWFRILHIKPQDEARDITADYEGNIYITGDVWEETQQGIVQPDSFVTACYQPDGRLDWVRVDGLSHYSWGEGIGFDPSGQLLVAGGCYDSILDESSGAILCYSLDGTLLWHWTYRQENQNCRFTDIVIAQPGVCYVIGEVVSADNDTSDFLVLKLRYPVGMAKRRPAEVPGGDIAFTTLVRAGAPLRFSLPGAGDYRLVVRDVSGQERVVYAGYLPAGENHLSLPQLPAGVYFLDLAGAGTHSRHRLVVVK